MLNDSEKNVVDERHVAQRADDRPPEEASSDDPTTQAAVILAESAERTEQRSAESEPEPRGGD